MSAITKKSPHQLVAEECITNGSPLKFKALILDIDGTLTASNSEALPSQRVIDAVKKASVKLHVAVATGRPIYLAQRIVDALSLKGLSVFNGGAEIINLSTGALLFRKVISVDDLQEAVKLCLPFGYDLYTSDDQYGTIIKSPDQIKVEAEKLFIDTVRSSDAIHIIEELEALPGVAGHLTSSWSKGDVVDIHITHAEATKRHGVEELIRILGITKEQVVAIGDHHNDLPMLMAAGYKVVMGDGPEEVKKQADFVTASLADDGVAVAIEKLILPAKLN